MTFPELTIRTYLYNPRLWLLVAILMAMAEPVARCGDSYYS